jgi:hypothetical protein
MRRFEYWFNGTMILETIAKNRESAEHILLRAVKIKQKEIIRK